MVADYLAMRAADFAGVPYSKADHRRRLQQRLDGRSEQAIEYKHRNISAVLLDAGFPNIPGYKPLWNVQGLLAEIVAERLPEDRTLLQLASDDADRLIVPPEPANILDSLVERGTALDDDVPEAALSPANLRLTTNYIEREARNRSLGEAGERFVLEYERQRLCRSGREILAARIEHSARVRGDGAGFDILSFEDDGAERLIEVKTTKYGSETPFFVTRNEVAVSQAESPRYQVYRLFDFARDPHFYTLAGAIDTTCRLSATTYLARPA